MEKAREGLLPFYFIRDCGFWNERYVKRLRGGCYRSWQEIEGGYGRRDDLKPALIGECKVRDLTREDFNK